jgi:hypothetical protein
VTSLRSFPNIRVEVTGARGQLGIDLQAEAVPGEFLVSAPGGGRKFLTASGTGADAGLRTDLAAPAGVGLTGFSHAAAYVQGSTGAKLGLIINVQDAPYNAKGDGATDDYPAFAAAYAACPPGGTVYVPKPAASYYLSANPDPYGTQTYGTIPHTFRAKNVHWQIDAGASFIGPGVGLPTGLGPQFLSQLTNPYNQTFGRIEQIDLTNNVTLNGGCLIGDTKELAEDFGYAYTITGDLTNGQATIVNASVNLFGKIKRGDRIQSSVTGWPQPGAPMMRVWDVSSDGRTITFGVDAGAGPAAPTNWSGVSQTGAAFTIYKKQWMALEYRGLNTGGPNSIDMAYGIRNDVINLTGGPANSYEIDMISLATTGLFNRDIFMTGHGDAPNTLTAIDIQRAGATPWSAAMAVRCATVGIFLNAKNPISIDATYLNPTTGLPEPVNYGIHLNNAPAILGGAFEAGQITNGAPGIALWRATDSSPTGDFFQGYTAGGSKVAFIDVLGGAHFTTLQLGQVSTATSDVAVSGYVTISGSDGNPIKLATVA